MSRIRIYLNILLALVLIGGTLSCKEDHSIFESGSNVRLTLNLEGGATRATENGVDDLNENVIKSVDLFFYKKGSTSNTLPSYSVTDIQIPDGTTYTARIDISIPLNKYNELFPTDADTECEVYAIVNRPASDSGDNALPDDKSLASLKENTILCAEEFKKRYEDPITNQYTPSKQASFVMDGFATVTRSGYELTGIIPVERVATKISLIINGIDDEVIDENGVVWLSDKNSVRISLRRASIRTKLGSTPTEYIYAVDKEKDLFSMDAITPQTVGDKIMTTVPFYSYPTNWTNDENSRTHLILVVEWTKKENPTEKILTYYEVNVNASGSFIQRNRHYKIYQEISVLGSTEESTPTVIYPSNYVILEWCDAHGDGGDTETDANLSSIKYLVVDELQIDMDNISSKQIAFFSSDKIDLSSVRIRWENMTNEKVDTITFATIANATRSVLENGDILYVIENNETVDGVENRVVQQKNSDDDTDYRLFIKIHNADSNNPNDRSFIKVEHNLDNSMDKDADYTSYYIDLVMNHVEDVKYSETINITQNPMIVVKCEANSKPNNNGGVYVNNGTGTYGGVHGLTGSNKNPNRYIISLSALDKGNSYIIGDPRKSSVDNLGDTPSAQNFAQNRPTMKYPGDTNNRRLKYYHPTIENASTSQMISPQFMIASSYGVTNPINKDDARNRCATYQEDGYPAGRWRIPTQSEIEYIVKLSAWGIIPTLFGTTGSDEEAKYWSANGAVTVQAKSGIVTPSTDTSNGPVRCVYDTWYWTDNCPKTTFTWGDKATF